MSSTVAAVMRSLAAVSDRTYLLDGMRRAFEWRFDGMRRASASID